VPVVTDITAQDHHLFRGEDNVFTNPASDCINIGLVNNMPDSALVSTERQLFELIDAAASSLLVRLRFYTIEATPRSDWGRDYVRRFYFDNYDLWDSDLDGVIVTGAEPQTSRLIEEPYWDTLRKTVDWATDNTLSAIWSCLAVHGAVLHLDGIDRHPLPNKCVGVFDQKRLTDHPLMQNIGPQLKTPHSRWNEVREVDLVDRGYTILTKSAEAGVDTFIKRQSRSMFIFFQGHPEYEAQSLLGEYRRDIGRFLRRELDTYPAIPKGYFDDKAKKALIAFKQHAILNKEPGVLASFPVEIAAMTLKRTWYDSAKQLFKNWLLYLQDRKRESLGRTAGLMRPH